MRVLGVGQHADLGDLYLKLAARGHEVRVQIEDPDSHDILEGLLTRTPDWQRELDWVRSAGNDGFIVFEGTGYGEVQDRLRREGFRVIGGSAVGDRLELDRAFGQRALRDAGMRTAATHECVGFDEGLAFVEKNPGRYVLKFNGSGFASTRNYVGVLDDGRDMLATLALQKRRWTLGEIPSFVLMEHVTGVEVGVGGFFDGNEFLKPVNVDWEHKRFFPNDLGELTGEMGTVVSYEGAERLFEASLAHVAPVLRGSGYVGYVNLNMIVNDAGLWPLELTCRFGYPGFAILSALHDEPWDVLLGRMLTRESTTFRTHRGFAVGIVLTVPPYPYPDGYERLSKGAPICFRSTLDDDDRAALHFGEVRREGDQLVTAGQIGYVMVVTGRGESIALAREAALSRARKVVIPNVRYRSDIGVALEQRDYGRLVALGWMP